MYTAPIKGAVNSIEKICASWEESVETSHDTHIIPLFWPFYFGKLATLWRGVMQDASGCCPMQRDSG